MITDAFLSIRVIGNSYRQMPSGPRLGNSVADIGFPDLRLTVSFVDPAIAQPVKKILFFGFSGHHKGCYALSDHDCRGVRIGTRTVGHYRDVSDD